MIPPGGQRFSDRRSLPIALTVAVGLSLSVIGFVVSRNLERDKLQAEFGRRTENLVGYLTTDVVQKFSKDNLEALTSVAHQWAETENGSPDELTELGQARATVSNDTVHVSFIWMPRVTDSNRPAFEAAAPQRSGSNFEILDATPNGGYMAARHREEYFPAYLLAPQKKCEVPLGYDISGDPECRSALDWTRDTGLSAVICRLPLNEKSAKPNLFLQVTPVYRGGPKNRNTNDRRADLKGYMAIVTETYGDVGQARASSAGGINAVLYEKINPTIARFIGSASLAEVDAASIARAYSMPNGLKWSEGSFKMVGRVWAYLGLPADELIQMFTDWHPWGILGGGLAITAFLVISLLMSLGREMKVEALVRRRTLELDKRTAELLETNRELEREVAERKKAEELNLRLAAFPSQNPGPVLECTLDGEIIYLNAAAERIISSLKLDSPSQFLPENHREIIATCCSDGNVREDIEVPVGSQIFSWLYHHIPATNTMHLYATDITERRHEAEEKAKLEAQLRHSQKMEGIGTLAGGIAHDFNNLLSGVLGYANMLKISASPGDQVFKAADVIEKAAERASQLTKQLLGFARKGKMQNVPVDVHGTIQEVVALLTRTIDKNISITQRLGAQGACVLGDPGQLQQVILNLAINARDAMPQGGELSFRTDLVELEKEDCASYPEAAPGHFVMVSVSDTGMGIPKDIQDRIFEPFFTTKEQGKGTGMGLAMVYGIVKNHGGSLRLYSEPGQGATFRVYLPLVDQAQAIPVAPERDEPVRGQGRILVVDDEEVVRDMASDMLKLLGYEVLTACNGLEAIECYKECGSEIDLAIIDMVMPAMGGRDCFRALKELNPEIKAVLSTGFGRDGAAQEILDEGMSGFAQKPYHIRQFAEVVANALDGGDRSLNSN